MLLQRDMLIVLLALGVAALLYVVSFRDLIAAAAPAAGTSPFEHSQGGVEAILPTVPARAV
ncbi:MAG: hypothetical protein ACREE7_05860 [Dongiaceae bacterium]